MAQRQAAFRPGALWPDTDGKHINAHGGGVLFHKGTYYWYGEHKSDSTSSAYVGVMCYKSKDLLNWICCGPVLRVESQRGSDIEAGCILERPKVIYNSTIKKFVMWFHLELKGHGYAAARSGVAVSDQPTGPFVYLRSGRPNPYKYPSTFGASARAILDTLQASDYPQWWTPSWYRAVEQGLFVKRDLSGGQMARDMTLYVDDDGTAYHIFSSEENLTLQIAELSDDYTYHTGRYVRMAPGGQNEAPALFKRNGRYWMITSGCTGWAPNEARMFSASSILGPWTQYPSPCVGPDAKITFGAQSTYILPVQGKKDAFIFMADMWRPKHPSDARYVWLPVTFKPDGTPQVVWRDEWTLDCFDD